MRPPTPAPDTRTRGVRRSKQSLYRCAAPSWRRSIAPPPAASASVQLADHDVVADRDERPPHQPHRLGAAPRDQARPGHSLQIERPQVERDVAATLGGRLERQGVEVGVIAEITSDLNRGLLAKVFELVAPPSIRKVGCLMVMGSEGRREQTVRTDQDNGLLLAEAVDAGEIEGRCQLVAKEQPAEERVVLGSEFGQGEGLAKRGGILGVVFVIAGGREQREPFQQVGIHPEVIALDLRAGTHVVGQVAHVDGDPVQRPGALPVMPVVRGNDPDDVRLFAHRLKRDEPVGVTVDFDVGAVGLQVLTGPLRRVRKWLNAAR